jgi:hypothetical protein
MFEHFAWENLIVALCLGVPLGSYCGIKWREYHYKIYQLPNASWNKRDTLPTTL